MQIQSQTTCFHHQKAIAKGSRSQCRLDKISEGLILSAMPLNDNVETAILSPESREYAAFFKTNIFPMLLQSASFHESQFSQIDLFDITMEVCRSVNVTQIHWGIKLTHMLVDEKDVHTQLEDFSAGCVLQIRQRTDGQPQTIH